MRAFYGSRFSNNMTRTPEGFLICHNVPIARTGEYEYLRKELGLEKNPNEIVTVYRNPEEVFSKKAIASFEGKIITDEHPPDLLTPENAQRYAKGSLQNVRQSKEESDLLLADLILYDKRLIEEVLDGKREVSCGYDCIYIDNGNGTYNQTEICGNHVAVVKAGRAGNRVAIKDSNKEMEGEKKKMSKTLRRMAQQRGPVTNILAALGLKHYVADAEPEEIADTIEALAEERQCDEGVEVQEVKKPDDSCHDEAGNSEIAALTQQVAKLTEIVMQVVKPKETAPEDAIDALINELGGQSSNDSDGEGSETVEMDEDIPNAEVTESENLPKNPIPGADSAAKIMALKAIKPIIAAIPDANERKKACDSVIAEFKKVQESNKKNGYADIVKAQRSKASDAAAKRAKTADERAKANEELGDIIARKYNANLREGK